MNFILGDIHGNVKKLQRIIDAGYASGGTIYQIGDFGLGDLESFWFTRDDLDDINYILKKTDTQLKVIRGNHDNPKYWNDDIERKLFNSTYTNIELLKDYHQEVINDKTYLFIGGAVSIDRVISEPRGQWWSDEIVTPPSDGLESLNEVDVVVAHNCPSFFNHGTGGENLKSWIANDENLLEDLTKERILLDQVFDQVKPKEWFSGHFHNKIKDVKQDCKYQCINIDELHCLDEYIPFSN